MTIRVRKNPHKSVEHVRGDALAFRNKQGGGFSITRETPTTAYEVFIWNNGKTAAITLTDEQAAHLWNWLQKRTEQA